MMKTIPGIEKRQLSLILAFGLSFMLVAVHAYVVIQGENYAGPFLIVDHFFNVGLILALLTLCAAVGLCLLSLFRFTFDEPLEALLFSVAIGCGAVALSILVLGFLSALRGITLAGIVVVWSLVARKRFPEVLDLIFQATIDFKAQSSRLSLVVWTVVAAFIVSQALLPPRDWDSLMYHLRVPAQFLNQAGFFVPEDNFHVAYVQLVHMLYLPLLKIGSLAGPALLSAFFALLLGLGVFTLARRICGQPIASFSLTVLWASTMLLLVAITPRVDVTLAYFLLLAHFALFMAWNDWRFYYLAAVLLGLAFGVKYNALLYSAVLSPLIVYLTVCKAPYLATIVRDLTSFGLIFSGTALPWLLKNSLLLGAPLYPFFTQTKINSWLAFAYPDQIFSESVNPKILTMLGEVRTSLNLLDLFLNPSALTVEAEAVSYHLNPLFLCLALWFIAVPKTRTLNWLLIPPLGYLAILLIFLPETNLRYLIPVIAPLTIGAVALLVPRLIKIAGKKKGIIAMSFIALLVLWPTIQTVILWTLNKQVLTYVVGLTPRKNYLKNDVFPPDYYFLAQTVAHVNQHFTPDHRILMLFEARGFYVNIPVIQDNILTNWPLLANKLPSIGCLEASGISHVLINTGALGFYFSRGLDPDVAQWKTFQEFAERCLSRIYEHGTHIIYAVERPNRNDPSASVH